MNTDNNERPYLLNLSEAVDKAKSGSIMEGLLNKNDVSASQKILIKYTENELMYSDDFNDYGINWVKPIFINTDIIFSRWREYIDKAKRYRFVFGLSNGDAFLTENYITYEEAREREKKYGYVWRVQLFETEKEF